jgi:4-amino-4-deoxy-L-arabinose transferase-like glycosyltransferase
VWLTPAVTTTWLGSLGLLAHFNQHAADIGRPLSEWLVSFSHNKIDLEVLLAMRRSMAFFTALMTAVVYGLARQIWSRPLALLGSLILLAEPFLLAVSRIIGHDAPATYFAIASLLAFLFARRLLSDAVGGYRWFILSGIFAGLAILSKAPALFLIPFAGLIATVDLLHKRRHLKVWSIALLVWGGSLFLTFVLFWPAAWANPIGQFVLLLTHGFRSSAGLEDADVQPTWSIPDLGPFYYLVNGAFRISPILLLGLALAAFAAWRLTRRPDRSRPAEGRGELIWLTAFALLFGLFMTFGIKKSPRYILPVLPGLGFVAAWGWLYLTRRWKSWLTVAVSGGLALLLSLNYAPYYFTYFNPLLGGPFTAPRLIGVGWGEGLDEVARRLNRQPDAFADHLGARYTATIYPFYEGDISSPVSPALDYVAFYIKQSQSGYPAPEILAYFQEQQPLHRISLNGIEYAQVYAGPAMQPVEIDARPDMPLAFRPLTVYAPIGGRLAVDLLWPANLPQDRLAQPVELAFESNDRMIRLKSTANITARSSGVLVSRHNFDMPSSLPRDTYSLALDQEAIGSIDARLMDLSPDFQPLDIVLAQQLKLAGIRQQLNGDDLFINLAWRAWPKATNDYTVFVQLLNATGERVAGVDVLPEQGFTTLDRREMMVTQYVIPQVKALPPGDYTLLIGLYYFAGEALINAGATTLAEPYVVK